MYLENEDVARLAEYYSDALEQIFAFYATSDKRTKAALTAQAVEKGHLAAGPYAATASLTLNGRSPMRATRGANSMKEVRIRVRRRGLTSRSAAAAALLCTDRAQRRCPACGDLVRETTRLTLAFQWRRIRRLAAP